MEISMRITLDSSGFIRRECPTCESEFKWFYGETAERPDDFLDPENYFCPYCGVPAGKDSWWTPTQLEYMASVAREPVTEEIGRELSGTGFKFSPSPRSEVAEPPSDPDDMVIVEPPCHPFEPLKILEDRLDRIHCLMCGLVFTV
ncbi:hypothetical protein ABT186_05740 [Streptomyces sp. NPDC001634]|uniref:hypothetical protein n=1 Tax=Streptomyces sp. NPDC001634 TaxID=3154390 RepID=UPI00331922D9